MARKGDRTNSLENSFSLLTFREDTVRLAVGEKSQGQRTFFCVQDMAQINTFKKMEK